MHFHKDTSSQWSQALYHLAIRKKNITIHIGMFAFRPEILSSGKTAVPPAPPAGRWRQSTPPAPQSGWWARSGARCGHRGLPAPQQSPPSSRSLRRLQSYKRQETREVNDGMRISLGAPWLSSNGRIKEGLEENAWPVAPWRKKIWVRVREHQDNNKDFQNTRTPSSEGKSDANENKYYVNIPLIHENISQWSGQASSDRWV